MPHRCAAPQQTLLRRITESFHKVSGLPLHFHQAGEFHVGEDATLPPFCRLMARGSNTCRRCVDFHLSLQDPRGREIRTNTCFAGLTSSAIPVRKGNKLLGYLHAGHANIEKPSCCAGSGKECRIPGRPKGSGCSGACRSTPLIQKGRYEGAVEMLSLMAENVAGAMETWGLDGAYPAIERAMHAIQKDITKNWTLTAIAKHVGMHPGYFSEKFHQHVGVTFSNFLSELRVEHACQLLRFTSLPMSEVAFASGFRSISQFNRTFKKLTHRTPGEMHLELKVIHPERAAS